MRVSKLTIVSSGEREARRKLRLSLDLQPKVTLRACGAWSGHTELWMPPPRVPQPHASKQPALPLPH